MGNSLKSLSAAPLRVLPKTPAFLIFLLVALLLRFPFFFRDYIDRDESTFILMGQAWVDGYLPYTMLWDVKPPLTFLFYAGIIYVFGKSFIALRVAGALVVALTGWLTYKMAQPFTSGKIAIIAGLASIYLQSLFGAIQGVMSEHILISVFMAGCYFLVREHRPWNLFLAGVLFGIALMIKINSAFPLLVVGIWLLLQKRHLPLKKSGVHLLFLVIPGVLVIFLTYLPYALSGQGAVWWDSVVLAPLGYTEGKGSSLLSMIGINGILLGFLSWAFISRRISWTQTGPAVMWLAVFGFVLSFLKAGRVNSHYLIQIYPPLMVLLAVVLGTIRIRKAAAISLVLLALLAPMESYLEYFRIVRHKAERGTWYNGEGFSVPSFLKESNINTKDILFLEYHIGYWVLDRYPPDKASTHPSNLCKAEMFPYYNTPRTTALEELHFLMDSIRPPIVVTRLNRLIFDKSYPQENAYMDSVLQHHYDLLKSIDKAVIYSRKPGKQGR